MDHVGERLKKLREKMGLTQEQLAQQIPVSLSSIQRWERVGGPIRALGIRREVERLFREYGIVEEGESEPDGQS